MSRPFDWRWSILFCIGTVILLSGTAQADMIPPAITHVYFDKDGTPYNGSVQYSVRCYGYFWDTVQHQERPAGSYQPELIFSYAATCPAYGGAIYQPYYYSGHIDWCDLEGQAGNEWFAIGNFSPYPYSRCDWVEERVQKRWSTGDAYYYQTPEYFSCRQVQDPFYTQIWVDQGNFTAIPPANRTGMLLIQGTEYYATNPWNHSILNRSDIGMDPVRYTGYLETCNPVADWKCPGWTVDGVPLKAFGEYRTLAQNATDREEHPCNRFLVEADPSLIMPFTDPDPWRHPCVDACNYTYELCESRFSITSANTMPRTSREDTAVIPWTVMYKRYTPGTTPTTLLPPSPRSLVNASPHPSRSPVESAYCGILAILGISC